MLWRILHVVAAYTLVWGVVCKSVGVTSFPHPDLIPSFLPSLPSLRGPPWIQLEGLWSTMSSPADSVRARPPNGLWLVHFELKIMSFCDTKYQQSTTCLCHNWNSELTSYANKQKSDANYTDNLVKSWDVLYTVRRHAFFGQILACRDTKAHKDRR